MFYSKVSSIISYTFLVLFSLTSVGLLSTTATAAGVSDQDKQKIATLTANINQATAQEISDVMTGVGLKKATSIVDYRIKIGSFKSIDDLVHVKGIGPATLKKNRHKIKI